MAKKNENAEAVIDKGCIVIRVRIDALPDAVRMGSQMMAIDPPLRVTDAKVFAQEVCHALNDEDEDGTTPIHRLFDAAFTAAADQGAEGVETDEVDDD